MSNKKRKIKKYILIAEFVLIAVILICAGKIFYNLNMIEHSNITVNKNASDKTESALLENNEREMEVSEMNVSEDAQQETVIEKKYIFVGDSRYVGMKKFADKNDIFIAENGQGFEFLNDNLEKIYEYADENSIVIIGLGVNDYGVNYRNYIKTVNMMANSLECPVYYMLINPVDEEKQVQYGYTVYNEMIDKYNKLMMNGFNSNVRIIDTNSYLKEDGFTAADGLHYDSTTYKKIYNYIKSNAI